MGLTWLDAIKIGGSLIKEVSKSPAVQKALFGTYTDGNVRSMADAFNGEIYSPKEKDIIEKRVKKNKKKKKKKKKNGEKYAKIDLEQLAFSKDDIYK